MPFVRLRFVDNWSFFQVFCSARYGTHSIPTNWPRLEIASHLRHKQSSGYPEEISKENERVLDRRTSTAIVLTRINLSAARVSSLPASRALNLARDRANAQLTVSPFDVHPHGSGFQLTISIGRFSFRVSCTHQPENGTTTKATPISMIHHPRLGVDFPIFPDEYDASRYVCRILFRSIYYSSILCSFACPILSCAYACTRPVISSRQGESYFTRSRRFLANLLTSPTFSLANIPARRPVFMVAEENYSAFLRSCFLRLRETLDFLERTSFPRQFAADVHKGRDKTRR